MNLGKTISAQKVNANMYNGKKRVVISILFQYICKEGNEISRLDPIVVRGVRHSVALNGSLDLMKYL